MDTVGPKLKNEFVHELLYCVACPERKGLTENTFCVNTG